MKKSFRNIVITSLASMFMIGGAFAALPKTEVSAATSSDFDCTYSIGDKNDSFNCSLYLCQEIRLYTADEAAAAGIPAAASPYSLYHGWKRAMGNQARASS